MGTKKNKKSEKSEKCIFYDRGYCSNGENCEKLHPDKVCPNLNCFDEKCSFRHSNPCGTFEKNFG